MSTPHALSPVELASVLEAERAGAEFVHFRDGLGDLRIVPLGDDVVAIGRAPGNDVVLGWDRAVSRTHVQLTRVGASWVVADDGLSRNGCWVNAEPLRARRRLMDRDVLRLGETSIVFRAPTQLGESTAVGSAAELARLTNAERRVLVALCRPVFDDPRSPPAANRVIAEELGISAVSVKSHLRALFTKLDVESFAQYEKRSMLVRRALDTGIVAVRDLTERNQPA